jgi:hypothetical protein
MANRRAQSTLVFLSVAVKDRPDELDEGVEQDKSVTVEPRKAKQRILDRLVVPTRASVTACSRAQTSCLDRFCGTRTYR